MTLLVQDGTEWMGLLPAISRPAIGAWIFTILAKLSFRSDQKVVPLRSRLFLKPGGVALVSLPAGSSLVGHQTSFVNTQAKPCL